MHARRQLVINLKNKRILVTQANEFMGPALCDFLARCGATVIPDNNTLIDPKLPEIIINAAGPIDALIINLAIKDPASFLPDVTEDEWKSVFDVMVHPLPRLVKAAIPGMKQNGGGKIVVMGSASALRGMKRTSSYSAARGAQLAFVQAAGVELAPDNIQLNAIAQIFVENPTYFPLEVQQNPRFQERIKRDVPLGRLVTAEEDVSFAAYLCSDMANCFVGQVFPMAGGWATK
jgi:2-keto-3-deoxy-L-fuconate dehydrogenase